MNANTYSSTWFETFLRAYRPDQTDREIDFITRMLPQPRYRAILDICCGPGRIALPLAERGYRVTGLDRDAASISEARTRGHGRRDLQFIQRDMRQLEGIPGDFDAALIMWASFGYFDEETNTSVLRQIFRKLVPSGRLILDVYHRDFFVAHLGTESSERAGRTIVTTRSLRGKRLRVHIDYGPDSPADVMEWELYTPDEMCIRAAEVGFKTVVQCADFDETRSPTGDQPRMQFVLKKPGVPIGT